MRSPRVLVVAVLAFVGFYLLRLGMASSLSGGVQALALLAGAVIFVASLWALMRGYAPSTDEQVVRNPKLAQFLFESPRSAPLWLGARVYVGYEWFEAGRHKISDGEWMAGTGLRSYWERAVAQPEGGRAPITYDWYREFIAGLLNGGQETWFAPLVAYGELLVGIALVAGALVGVAAFFGALMNMSFMLAGSASTNPVLFTLGIALILGWKVAGYLGVDRWLLPILGAPWNPGPVFGRPSAAART